MSREDLERLHDQLAPRGSANVNYCLNELARRDQADANRVMLGYTNQVKVLTWVIAGATIIMTAIQVAIALGWL